MTNETITLALEDIKPYPNNPRRIPRQAIEAVALSIDEYGYRQPIVVDKAHVVIVGHTRLEALKALGWTEAEVVVTDLPEEKANEYRLIDNRTGEMTEWDHNALVMELREFDSELLNGFFPEVDLEIKPTEAMTVTDEDMLEAEKRILRVKQADELSTHMTTVECPACTQHFEVRTKSLPGLTWDELNGIVYGDE